MSTPGPGSGSGSGSGSGEHRRWLPPTDAPPPAAQPAPAPEAQAPAGGGYAQWPGEPASTGGPGETAGGRPAGWLSRVGAAVVDFFVRLAMALAGLLVGALFYVADQSVGDVMITVGVVIGVLAGLAYAPVMIARTGSTVGHRAVDTKIVRQDGTPLTGGGAFVREVLVKSLLFEAIGGTFLLVPMLLNYLWPLWDADNEALHDKLCSTRVVEA